MNCYVVTCCVMTCYDDMTSTQHIFVNWPEAFQNLTTRCISKSALVPESLIGTLTGQPSEKHRGKLVDNPAGELLEKVTGKPIENLTEEPIKKEIRNDKEPCRETCREPYKAICREAYRETYREFQRSGVIMYINMYICICSAPSKPPYQVPYRPSPQKRNM